MKRILLIVPPRTVNRQLLNFSRIANIFPLGLMYIAAVLEKNGYYVEILDCLVEDFRPHEISEGLFRFGMTNESIVTKIRKINPDIIGISCMFTSNYKDFIELCALIKENFKVPIIAGGPHVTAEYKSILKTGLVDYCTLGESEYTFFKLIQALERNSHNIDDIKGLAYMKNNKIKANLEISYIENLDELPFPAYHLIDFDKYMTSGHSHGDTSSYVNWAPIVTSRGSPFTCTFCYGSIMSGRKIRYRSPENVIDEVKMLKDKYNIAELSIEDDNFAHNTERAVEILKGIKELNIRLVFPNGLSLYSLDNPEIVELLKENQVLSLSIAIESGDERILKKVMKKPVNISLARRVIERLKKSINVKAFFIIGMPGETVDSLRNTFTLIKELELDWQAFSIATPLPGTEMTKICNERGYINKELYNNIEKVNFSESVIDTPYLDHHQVTKYAYYFNVITNFIEPIERIRTSKEMKYKLFMYNRVLKMVPDHKYARISIIRVKIRETILLLKDMNFDDSIPHRLESIDKVLKSEQLRILNDELNQMPGEIKYFHMQERE